MRLPGMDRAWPSSGHLSYYVTRDAFCDICKQGFKTTHPNTKTCSEACRRVKEKARAKAYAKRQKARAAKR